MYLPVDAIELLPNLYKKMLNPSARVYKEGIVIKFVSVLFTQGIDIQQTIVNTLGNFSVYSTMNPLFSYVLFSDSVLNCFCINYYYFLFFKTIAYSSLHPLVPYYTLLHAFAYCA